MGKVIWEGHDREQNVEVRVVDADGWIYAERKDGMDATGNPRWAYLEGASAAIVLAQAVYRVQTLGARAPR